MKRYFVLIAISIIFLGNKVIAQETSNWTYDFGVLFFKSSLKNQPDEILYNPVFEKWESINQNSESYSVSEYNALEPYAFNLTVGLDGLFRYKKYLMLKIGYYYTNTLGIGGKGNIAYTNNSDGFLITEDKEMSYSSHQLTYFIGPLIPIGENGAEIFMGFSMMSPTYVSYKEKFKRSESGITVQEYDKKFTGFFGNCRSLFGMQVPLSDRWKFGSEIVFAYFNGMEIKSGDIADEGFVFPDMQWNFTFRYEIK